MKRMKRVEPFALVAFGGFVGAILRYSVGLAFPAFTGTLVANVVGSFVLGVLVSTTATERTRLLLGTGILSSFTTYSTFAVETTSVDDLRHYAEDDGASEEEIAAITEPEETFVLTALGAEVADAADEAPGTAPA